MPAEWEAIKTGIYEGPGCVAMRHPPAGAGGAENAPLLAAAPELYAVLDQCAEHFERMGPPLGESQEAHRERMLRANIRRALAEANRGFK